MHALPHRDHADDEIGDFLRLARRGNEKGYTELYRCLAPRVAGYVKARGVREVDDVVNEVFLGAFRNLHRFTGNAGDFRSWLFSIAWNKCADWHRSAARRPMHATGIALDDVRVAGGDVEDDALAGMATSSVEEMLEALTAEQRDVLLLRVVADMSLEQVAVVMDKPVGAVKALQHRALTALRKKLAEPVSPSADEPITRVR